MRLSIDPLLHQIKTNQFYTILVSIVNPYPTNIFAQNISSTFNIRI